VKRYLKAFVRRQRKRRNLRLGLKSRDPFVIMRELTNREQPVIFDIGAHVGLAATRYRELFPAAMIHSFEPYPESFALLREAIAGSQPIELHAIALAAQEGEAEFSVNRNSATNSLLASDERAEVYWRSDTPRTTGTLSVPTSTLDAVCREHGIDAIDILKMDVQGGELEVLRGGKALFERQAIGLVYMELITAPTYLGQHRIREYLEFFDSHDYELFDCYNLGRSGGRLLQTDVIFVSPELLRAHEQRLSADQSR
jgi:FkbM family methyltransferase